MRDVQIKVVFVNSVARLLEHFAQQFCISGPSKKMNSSLKMKDKAYMKLTIDIHRPARTPTSLCLAQDCLSQGGGPLDQHSFACRIFPR